MLTRYSNKRRMIRLSLVAGLALMVYALLGVSNATAAMSDAEITHAVLSELLESETVAAHLIDIDADDGVVTLTGTVGNLVEKRTAARIAKNITGVSEVENDLIVKPLEYPDEDIRDAVLRQIGFTPVVDADQVEVNVENGVVSLDGVVGTHDERSVVEELAAGIKGVRNIENNIDVVYIDTREDQEIAKDVNRNMEQNPWVFEPSVNVMVEDGKVTLTGTVGSAYEKSEAYTEAWAPGVVEVSNMLDVNWRDGEKIQRVKSDRMRTNEEIRESVEQQLLDNPNVSSSNVTISVDSRVVTLSGTVESLFSKLAAAESAQNAYGVANVVNDIRVRPQVPLTDEKIADNLRDAFEWDSIIEKFEIEPTVRNHKVYLHGTVDTYRESHRAQKLALQAPGVTKVENLLTVASRSEWKSDREIWNNIKEELNWSLLVDEDDITVNVEDGTAILSGEVTNYQVLQAVITNAFEGGAEIVENNLTDESGAEYHPQYFYRDRYDWH